MARRTLPSVRLGSFVGGLNLRDAPTELGPGDLSKALNVTLDEEGGISSRLGMSKYNGSVFGGGFVFNIFYWNTGGNIISQAGANLYKDTSTVAIKTFTTSARCAMADFAGKLCIVHPVDGMFTYDGAAFTTIATGPKADTITVWQNKLWTNDKSGTHPARINFCAAGDPATWNVSDFNDIRDVNDAQVVCVGAAGGSDIIDRAGLHVFKQRSSYWVYDSATGAYQTADPTVGAASALCSVYVGGRTLVLSERGIYAAEGSGGLTKVSGKLDPLFLQGDIGGISLGSSLSFFAAGAVGDRAFFSVIAATGDRQLEYHASTGSFTAHTTAVYCYTLKDGVLYCGSRDVSGQVYSILGIGSDDGAPIVAEAQTGFVEMNAGMRARLNRARVNGRGVFTLYPVYDYDSTRTISRAISLSTGSVNLHGGYQDVYNLGTGKAFGVYVSGSSTALGTVPSSLGFGGTRYVGGWGLYGVDLTAVLLGRT